MREHYNAVRKSDLYEYCGISKPLLMLIAGLLIAPPKEGQEVDPELPPGWCIASQDTLAAMFGCSPEEVNRQMKKFERDGWLTVKRFRDDRGYPRCHYAITPEQLKNIKTREMKKDEDGYYIRAKRPLSARKQESQKISQKNLIWKRHPLGGPSMQADIPPVAEKTDHGLTDDGHGGHPLDDSSKCRLIIHQEAGCESIKTPLDNPSIQLLSSVVPSLVVNSGFEAKAKAKDLPTKGKKEKAKAAGHTTALPEATADSGDAAAIRPVISCPLKSAVMTKLRDAGCPDAVFKALAGYTKMVTILNGETEGGCTNPVTAYATFARNNKKFGDLWIPVPTGAHTDCDADFQTFSALDREDLRAMEANMSDGEREREKAMLWWCRLTIPQRKEFPVTHAKDEDGSLVPNEDEILAAHRAAMEAKSAVVEGA